MMLGEGEEQGRVGKEVGVSQGRVVGRGQELGTERVVVVGSRLVAALIGLFSRVLTKRRCWQSNTS